MKKLQKIIDRMRILSLIVSIKGELNYDDKLFTTQAIKMCTQLLGFTLHSTRNKANNP